MGFQAGILGKGRFVAAGLLVALTVTGCAPIERYHGFVPPEAEIAALEIGVSTKEEVIALFGEPIADRALQNNTIYYAASKFEQFGPFTPQEVDRQVLAVSFDSADRVRNVSRYTLEDGRVVTLDRRVTDDGIADVSFLGQLLGSLGRFDAGTILGADQ
jgi:outer membrane protein assembly factor BamE (lipoprotein component of BamABCDE complex)